MKQALFNVLSTTCGKLLDAAPILVILFWFYYLVASLLANIGLYILPTTLPATGSPIPVYLAQGLFIIGVSISILTPTILVLNKALANHNVTLTNSYSDLQRTANRVENTIHTSVENVEDAIRSSADRLTNAVTNASTVSITKGALMTYETARQLVVDESITNRELEVVSYASGRMPVLAADESQTNERDGERYAVSLAIKAFDVAISKRIVDDGWKVRRIWVVNSAAEFRNVLDEFVNSFEDVRSYEVRVLAIVDTLPPTQQLIAGTTKALVALNSANKTGVTDNGILLTGREFANVLIEEFDSLWSMQKARAVRGIKGVDPGEVAAVFADLGTVGGLPPSGINATAEGQPAVLPSQ